MNRVTTTLVAIAALSLGAGSAWALGTPGTLLITGWAKYGGSASVKVTHDDFGTVTQGFSVGAFTGQFNGNNVGTLFCVDVFHSFGFNGSFGATRFQVPSQAGEFAPPPWNTDHAAYLFNTFAADALTSQTKAAGLQLAMWEVSHEKDWKTNWDASETWHDFGAFERNGGGNNSGWSQATTYLTTLAGAIDGGTLGDSQAYYYRDNNHPEGGSDYGQGQMGTVPEPGTVMLLGLGLVGIAGGAWRRRRPKNV